MKIHNKSSYQKKKTSEMNDDLILVSDWMNKPHELIPKEARYMPVTFNLDEWTINLDAWALLIHTRKARRAWSLRHVAIKYTIQELKILSKIKAFYFFPSWFFWHSDHLGPLTQSPPHTIIQCFAAAFLLIKKLWLLTLPYPPISPQWFPEACF